MKFLLLLSFGVCSIILVDSRLIEKITYRTLTTEAKPGSSPPVRLARQADTDDALTGISKEDSDEFLQTYNRKLRHFLTPKSLNSETAVARKRRNSSEQVDKPLHNITSSAATSSVSQTKPKSKPDLVKKPIPKYNEMDYDDDFQMKISKSPMKVLDSGEHEDEDFNLDDYDFDVNHDEFVGRGKPLEPRLKHKEIPLRPKPVSKPSTAPEIRIRTKVNPPNVQHHQGTSIKKERSIDTPKKTGEKEDYYDDTTARTKAPQKARDLEDEFNDDNEESKEFDSKMSNVRMVRSPWKIDAFAEKFGDKTSSVMSKILSILPMFPQVPSREEDMDFNLSNNQHNGA